MKRLVQILLMAVIFLCTSMAFASFTVIKNMTWHTSYDGLENNWSDSFTEGKNKYMFYCNHNAVAPSELVIKQKEKVVYTKQLPPIEKTSRTHAIQIKDDLTGRIFYIIDNQDYKNGFGYIIGYDPVKGEWQEYIDKKNYYTPIRGRQGISIRHGDAVIYNCGGVDDNQAYRLFWDKSANWFGYEDLGFSRRGYFDDALNQNPKYRPLYAHMDYEQYLVVDSIFTWQDDDTTWIFDADVVNAFRNTDLIVDKWSGKYKINKNTHQAWVWNSKKEEYEELPMFSSPYGFQMLSCSLVNWCYMIKYGQFLGKSPEVTTNLLGVYNGNF
jgi:hypothetical protein